MKPVYKIKAMLWIYDGPSAWHFFTIQKNVSKEIKKTFADFKRGWGSLPVKVTIGESSWKTSIFPDAKRDAYLLPVKSVVRKSEHLTAGKRFEFTLEILTSDIL